MFLNPHWVISVSFVFGRPADAGMAEVDDDDDGSKTAVLL